MLASVFFLTAAPNASAQGESDQAVAQALFDQARELMQKKDFARACVLFERSEALDPGGGTLLNLAVCYEAKGALARAYATYQEVLSEAHREKRADRAETATRRIDAITPRLPRILIKLPEHASDPNLVVQLDDVIMGSSIVGVATPVDPGMHHLRVSRLGMKPWTWDGEIAPGQTQEIAPDLAPLDVLPASGSSDPCGDTPCGNAGPVPPPTRPTEWQRSRVATGSWVLGGVAVAATVTSIVTGVLALDAQSSWKSQCLSDRGYCADPAAASSDASRGRAFAWTSTISAGVGVAAILGAILWPRTTYYERLARGNFSVAF